MPKDLKTKNVVRMQWGPSEKVGRYGAGSAMVFHPYWTAFFAVWFPWYVVAVIQSLNHVRLFATPWIEALQFPLPSLISRRLFKFRSIESVMLSNHLILCWPLLLLPSVFPSIKGFSNESSLSIRWPKNWSLSFSFSISPSNEILGLISFRIDWFDLHAIKETLKSLLRHHSLEASIFWCSAFFMVLLSHPDMTTGKTIALNIWNFFCRARSLLFNTLSLS